MTTTLVAGVNHVAVLTDVWFEDPDGMRGELTLIVDPALASIHAPRPLTG